LGICSITRWKRGKFISFSSPPGVPHGVPNHPTPLLQFIRKVKALTPTNEGPIVTHCRFIEFVLLTDLLTLLNCPSQFRPDLAPPSAAPCASIQSCRRSATATESDHKFPGVPSDQRTDVWCYGRAIPDQSTVVSSVAPGFVPRPLRRVA